ncbi:thioredoxin [Ancrocorticia populi]|uniref:Thioredoxin n=1 Tax=Ancrocorticia populi TaxID=2175228 RepID=A0A2V1KED9_9ACTO|nr:thioredoxin [Ancrocorticia populi]
MHLELFSSSFCGACRRTRGILDTAARLVPSVYVTEINVADDPDAAERVDITSTPTVIVRDSHGKQTFRGEGVPNINQVLAATVAALDA